MKEITISRPVTIQKIADNLGVKSHHIMADLARMSIFSAPDQIVDDESALALSKNRSVNLKITDLEEL